ncbi:glycoside hydrolase [Salipaludibacillus neizhouensis]|uniref:Glycoside hydrolase n=1 Tax=Salipaludibacillus neizhouensis TaxID=885475 RepID=A0A3A9KGX4_9BACI|nr:glycoside hydrolase [Salipaludibacillus neizhouensis]
MLKKILGLSFIIGMGSLLVIPNVFANTELDTIKEERTIIQSGLSDAEQELAELVSDLDEINNEIASIDEALVANQKTIDDTNEEVDSTEKEVEKLEVEIKELEDDIEIRFEMLKDRANAYQKNGGSSRYLEVLLGADSFGDFVTRSVTITRIAKADNDFIEQLEINQKELEEKQATVQGKLDELEELQTELVGMKHHLEDQNQRNDELKNELKSKEAEIESKMARLLEEDSNLQSEEAEIQAKIDAEIQRQEDLRKAEEAEIARQAEEEAAATQSNTNSSSSPNVASASDANTNTTVTNTDNKSKSSSSETKAAPAPSSYGGSVTQVGRKYIGNSTYVFGGGRSSSDIANGRFDCSAFVSWSFSQVGKSLPASTGGLVNAGQRISSSDKQPGDLVFFNTYKTNGHVGIYIGGGQFIGSQSSTGVAVANMNSGYWADNFSGVVVRVN